MKPKLSYDRKTVSLDRLALEIYESLARRFPICLGSDEFHFFPHYRSIDHDWSAWDDFSPESVEDTISRISHWEQQLNTLSFDPFTAYNVGASVLGRLLTTLREQLTWVRFHETQPTFYLTIAGIGLAEAFDAGPLIFAKRMAGLPEFLDRAMTNLKQSPQLYRDLGLEMAKRIDQWLTNISRKSIEYPPAGEALRRFILGLTSLETRIDFLLSPDLYARIAERHMGCCSSLGEIEDCLTTEIEETGILLNKSAADLRKGLPWQKVLADLPSPGGNLSDPYTVYGEVIENLHRHCHARGFLPAELQSGCQVRVEEIPDSMRPVRSDAAFSMPPGNPPSTGIFYILPLSADRPIPADYRLLSAHETYPGHQLLDTSRWLLEDIVLRSIEFPLFYEGWASFSEEILFDTGFFDGPVEHFLMAKRRYWRAQRGLIDLRIHTGRWDLSFAAEYLKDKGLSQATSRDMVRRYALKPGYQLTYSIGRRLFRDLYEGYRARGGEIHNFIRSVMTSGEISFDNLALSLNLRE